jgi:hypothetical protein
MWLLKEAIVACDRPWFDDRVRNPYRSPQGRNCGNVSGLANIPRAHGSIARDRK